MLEILDKCLIDYKAIVHSMNVPMSIVTEDNIICYWSSAGERFTGYKAEEIIGQPYNKAQFLAEPEDDNPNKNYGIKSVLKNGIPVTWKGFIVRKNGQRIPVEVYISPIRDNDKIIGAIGIMHDISVLTTFEQTIREMLVTSRVDHLSGVNNRQAIDGILENEIERSLRYDQPLSVIMLDLDDFKKINDNFGHEMGDAVIREVGGIMNFNLRLPDSVGRWGGEEFVIVLPGSSLDKGRRTAMRICEYISDLDIPGLGRQVTASLGVAEHNSSLSAADLMGNADKAMYRAKENGKNQVQVFE